MNKAEFRDILLKRRLILDGATGSNLIKRGNMPSGVCPEKWILENPQILIGLQEDYFAAGSNAVYVPTFTANRIKLAEYGLENEIETITRELIALSKEAAGRSRAKDPDGLFLTVGDITMTGRQLRPLGTLETRELVEVYREQIALLIDGGVDLLVAETMMSLQECRCALIAAKELGCELPFMVTMTFEESGRALYGTDPLTALVTLQALGADAFGINCGFGPDRMGNMVDILTENSDIPVIVKPNAGMPMLKDSVTVYSMEADEFAGCMSAVLQKGVSIVGGCCGTDPGFIRELKKLDQELAYEPSFTKGGLCAAGKYALTSERKTEVFDLDSPFIIVGERINPTGKKALQAQLREGSFDMVRDFAVSQEESGAKILDVNMGMSGIDEKATMVRALEEICQVTSLPLVIDSSDPEVMEEALLHYPGRALVNSVSLEAVKIEKMLPLVKKYGAMMILLPLSDEGLPGSMEEKHDIIRQVMEHARRVGLADTDIVVDGLVATVGANKNAALETLATIRHCRDDLGLPTVCGLSNISFGLPERSFVNASFLTMAIMSGLTMAISNPDQHLLANTAFACDLLRNKEEADIRYIEQVNARKERLEEKGAFVSLYGGKEMKLGEMPSEGGAMKSASAGATGDKPSKPSKVYEDVMKGAKDRIVSDTKEAIAAGMGAKQILDEQLLPAINAVGDLFDRGKYFLPQLIASARAMEQSIEYLEPLLAEGAEGREKKGLIVIATVQGDIHDIGKNLVALMLRNNGYEVVDLGKDVPAEEIVSQAMERKADIIALSALMTTTMKQMAEVVEQARSAGCSAKIMIGGAVITGDYSEEIGADGFSPDAASAVKLADKLMQG